MPAIISNKEGTKANKTIANEGTYQTKANFIGILPLFKIIVTMTIKKIPTPNRPLTKLSDMFKPPNPNY